MRRSVLLALLCLASVSQADRLITVPTARKIPFGTIRYEFRGEPTANGQRENLIGLGFSTSFDTELRTFQDRGGKTVGTADFSFNYIAAIQGLTPGISLGIQDVADKTREGRRIFGAVTFRQPFATLNGDYPADITLGVLGYSHHATPYVGVEIPFSKEFHLLAEHDGNRIAAGAEYSPVPWLNLRSQIVGYRPLLSAQLTTRF